MIADSAAGEVSSGRKGVSSAPCHLLLNFRGRVVMGEIDEAGKVEGGKLIGW